METSNLSVAECSNQSEAADILALQEGVKALESRVKDLEKVVATFSTDAIRKLTDDYIADAMNSHEFIRGIIERFTVCTEIAFYAKQQDESFRSICLDAAFWVLDQPVEWVQRMQFADMQLKDAARKLCDEYLRCIQNG